MKMIASDHTKFAGGRYAQRVEKIREIEQHELRHHASVRRRRWLALLEGCWVLRDSYGLTRDLPINDSPNPGRMIDERPEKRTIDRS